MRYNTEGGTIQRLYNIILKSTLFALPPFPEQQAIAEALSDADAWIESLEALLQKKRLIKQGAMQELLRPKEGWEVKKLGEVIQSIRGGGTPSRFVKDYWNGTIPWATVKDFSSFDPQRTQEYISESGLRNSATHLVKAGSLIIATRIALGEIAVYDVDVAINQDLKTISLALEIDKTYFFHFYRRLKTEIIDKGSGSTVLGLSSDDLKALEICFPPIEEQRQIADTLSTIDAEIKTVKRQLAKARQIKQGMMQKLLTGQIRLVPVNSFGPTYFH